MKAVSEDIFISGDLVKVILNLHNSHLPDNRIGIILDVLPAIDKNWSDEASVAFSNWRVLKFHVCHLRKLPLN